MGPASAYAAVLIEIDSDIGGLIKTNPGYFTFAKPADGMVEICVVAFARRSPSSRLQAGIFGD